MTVEDKVSDFVASSGSWGVRELIKEKDKFGPLGTTIMKVDGARIMEGQLQGAFGEN